MTPTTPYSVLSRCFLVLATLTAAAMLAACGSTSEWSRVEKSQVVSKSGEFEVAVPVDWMQRSDSDTGVLVTRDGESIQNIMVARPTHDQAFAKIKKTSNADLLPNELAELLIAVRTARPGVSNLKVSQNEPVSFVGKDGVRLRMSYKTPRGASYDQIIYAAAEDKRVLIFEYEALSRTYFDRDLPQFETVLASFKDLSRPARR